MADLNVSFTETRNEANSLLNAERVRHQTALAAENLLFERTVEELAQVIAFLDKWIAEQGK